MTHAHQPTLFDEDHTATPAIDVAAFENATDHRLDEHSWITHVPGLLTGHLRVLVSEPRLTGEYVDLTAAPAFLAELAAMLSQCAAPIPRPPCRRWLQHGIHSRGRGPDHHAGPLPA